MHVLTITNTSPYTITIVNTAISIITTFFLCFFITNKILTIISASIIFQIMVLLSERLCLIISYFIYPSKITNEYSYTITMNLMSKLFLLIFVLLFTILWRKSYRQYPAAYNILLFITPILSLSILVIMPLSNDYIYSNMSFYVAVWIFLTLLNVIYLILIEKLSESYNNKMAAEELKRQLIYQKEKYIQLGESYKTCRRLIHDIKHHNETMKKYIRDGKYDDLSNYLSDFTNDLEKTYARFNTGNLVIDALLSNYSDLLKSSGIEFKTDLELDITRIPVSDYELSIIIGNLLDNSFKAVKDFNNHNKFVSVIIHIGKNDKFTIIIENSYNKNISDNTSVSEKNLMHGYGINNVKSVVEHNHGIIQIDAEDTYKTTIIIPIIEIEKRATPPRFPLN